MAQVGDEWALNELLAYHKRMIHKIANGFAGGAQSMTKEDLEQEVIIAVMKCLETWRPGAGASFFTYVFNYAPHKVAQIMGYTDNPVKIPSWAGQKMRKDYRETGKANRPLAVSMYKPALPDGGGEDLLIDEIEALNPPVDYERRDLVRFVAGMLDRLTTSEAEIVKMLTLGDMDQTEAAKALGCSRQHISAAYKRGIKKLQQFAERRGVL